MDQAVLEEHPRGDLAAAPEDWGHPTSLIAQYPADPPQRSIAGPGNGAPRSGDVRHQEVGVLVAQPVGHLVLELQQQAVAEPPCDPVQFHACRQEGFGGLHQRRRFDLAEHRLVHLEPAEGVDIAQAAAGLLEVRLEQEGDLAEPGVPLTDRRAEAPVVPSPAGRPLGPPPVCQGTGEEVVASHQPGAQQARGGVEALAGHLEDLVDRAHLVAQLQAGVPHRIPETVGDRTDLDAGSVYQCHVEVAARAQFPSPITTERHEGSAGRCVGRHMEGCQVLVNPIRPGLTP